jgi:hypothetical protein
MSDFDAVLERLLSDPLFQRALAADPDRALAGYDLGAEERGLLGVQFSTGTGAERTVETRTTKSGVIGMLGPVASAFGVAAGGGHQTLGSAEGGQQTLGSAEGGQWMGSAPGASDSFGHAPQSDGSGGSPTQTFGVLGAKESFGGAGGGESLGTAPGGSLGAAPVEATGYDSRIDVDGDGTWDAYTAYERADGGVDLRADMNHDGVADFVGHDVNRDGLVDSADYDTNLDGTLDTRMYDDNGDGWMDRSEPLPPQVPGSGPVS